MLTNVTMSPRPYYLWILAIQLVNDTPFYPCPPTSAGPYYSPLINTLLYKCPQDSDTRQWFLSPEVLTTLQWHTIVPMSPRPFNLSVIHLCTNVPKAFQLVNDRPLYQCPQRLSILCTNVPEVLLLMSIKPCFFVVLHHHTCVPKVLILSSETILYQCPKGLITHIHKKHCFSPVLHHHTCVPRVLILSSDTVLYPCPGSLTT